MSTEQGGLRVRLLEHAVAVTRERGPDALSLREVQRRSGVSAAAAYRHYRDREALLVAVGRHASARLADAIQQGLDDVPPGRGAQDDALARLRAGCAAYIGFALEEPGLYRSVFLTGEGPADLEQPVSASRGSRGLGPYELLQQGLAELQTSGVLAEEDAAWSDTSVWAASHGLATLFLSSPLSQLDDTQRRAATNRLLDVVVHGLAHRPSQTG